MRFFDHFRYDLAKVGRYKFNRKLNITERLVGTTIAEDIKDENGKVVLKKDTLITKDILNDIKDTLKTFNIMDVKIHEELDTYKQVQEIKVYDKNKKDRIIPIIGVLDTIDEKRLTIPDIYASVNYYLDLLNGLGNTDEIDNLANRRVRQVGELIEKQFQKINIFMFVF